MVRTEQWRRHAAQYAALAAALPLVTQLLSSIAGAQQLPNGIVVSHQKLKGRRNNTMLSNTRVVMVMRFSEDVHGYYLLHL